MDMGTWSMCLRYPSLGRDGFDLAPVSLVEVDPTPNTYY